jgi:enoyl-CoA hydratase
MADEERKLPRFETVIYEEPALNVARFVLNRPDVRNAQNYQLIYDLNAAFDYAAQDDDIKVIILAAADPHFSSGHDLKEIRSYPETKPYRKFKAVSTWGGFEGTGPSARYAREQEIYLQSIRRWRDLPKPTIAAVQGKCIAGGLMLAWACDLIVASDDALFCDPVVSVGVCGVEWFAHPWELGPRKAKEMLFTGANWTAEDARQTGMVSHVVPRADLESFTLDLAKTIAARPMFALRMTKEAVNRAVDNMGQRATIDHVFALHHLSHCEAAYEGTDAAGRPAGELLMKT